MSEIKAGKPRLYISYYDKGEYYEEGPFYTVTPDGSGAALGENWSAYSVQDERLEFRRVTLPTLHPTISCTSWKMIRKYSGREAKQNGL